MGHVPPHQFDHISGRQSKLFADRIEAGAVLPRHHDDPINLALVQNDWFLDGHDGSSVSGILGGH